MASRCATLVTPEPSGHAAARMEREFGEDGGHVFGTPTGMCSLKLIMKRPGGLCRLLAMRDGFVPKNYDPEIKGRAVRMVGDHMPTAPR